MGRLPIPPTQENQRMTDKYPLETITETEQTTIDRFGIWDEETE